MWRKIKNFYHLLVAVAFCLYYRFPAKKLKVIGVTGTDGKTTTTHLIYQILKVADKQVALVSSIKAEIAGEEYKTGFHVTTPSPRLLQKFLRKTVDKGIEYVVLETTSHALDQHRVFGIPFEVGVLTNVTREHLDYHKTYENYLATKAKLLQRANWAVVNRDDKSYNDLELRTKNLELRTYGIKNRADVVATGISLSPTRSEFIYRCMDTPEGEEKKGVKISTKLLGEHNVYNSLAAIGCGKILGISDETIKKALASFKLPEGRMEFIDKGQSFSIIIDFAHTPNALEKVLTTIRNFYPLSIPAKGGSQPEAGAPLEHTPCGNHQQSVIIVFGCAGLRDKQKRPIMGEIAAKFADLIILTAEDPRTEDVNDIIDQIAKGCRQAGAKESEVGSGKCRRRSIALATEREMGKNRKKKTRFFRIPDRRVAINFAIQKLAKKGDTVLITGKGHEKSMCFGKTEHPWNDKEAVLKALKERISRKIDE